MLEPEGYVRVGSERWRARLVGEVRFLPVGERAIIRDIDNLTLLVEPRAATADAEGETG